MSNYECEEFAYDFEYDGQYLSDFGFVVCNFDGSNGIETVEAGSVITFNTVPLNSGKYWSLTSTQYEDCIEATFQICKDPNKFKEDMKVDGDEYRNVVRWLNRREFLKFRLLNEDTKECDDRYYMASFNVEKVKLDDVLYGMELTMFTNKPFAYGQTQNIVMNIASAEKAYPLYDVSDEIGYIYPSMKITCNGSGTLMLKNSINGCLMEVKNCSEGEILTIDGDALFISSSNAGHKNLCNDFNYQFFMIENTYDNRVNNITSSIPCKIEFTYVPVIKDAP